MINKEWQDYVIGAYYYALDNGLIKTKRDFARLTHVHPSTLGLILNGTYKGDGSRVYHSVKYWREMQDQLENNEILDSLAEHLDSKTGPSPVLSMRAEIAARMLQVTSEWHITDGKGGGRPMPKKSAVKLAIEYADELINQLRNDATEED